MFLRDVHTAPSRRKIVFAFVVFVMGVYTGVHRDARASVCRENIFPSDSSCSTAMEQNRKSRGVIFDTFHCNCQLPTVYGSGASGYSLR